MIRRRGAAPGEPRTDADAARHGAQRPAWALLDARGLTRLGARVETPEPYACSSGRHRPEAQDKILPVLAGEAMEMEQTGAQAPGPGDAARRKAGTASAHGVADRADAPCGSPVVGTRVARNVVRSPDPGRTLHHDAPRRRQEDAEGRVLAEATV